MKDSQPRPKDDEPINKYIKESNERFSTCARACVRVRVSISRRVMKDSQPGKGICDRDYKYIKESNERFSTGM